MTLFGIVIRNLRYYWRQHIGVVVGAALCSMVLVGALMVGDSVKSTLRRLADERIGNASMALLATDGFFREKLAAEVAKGMEDEIVVAPMVVTRGNLSLPDGSIHVRNVQVLGVDERFWKLAPAPDARPSLETGAFFANERLYHRFKNSPHDRILLRVEEPGLFSRDAPLSGERDNKFVSLSNKLAGSVSSDGFGRFGLQGNQREPLTLFVPLKVLQKRMFRNFDEVAGKWAFANFLLLGDPKGETVAAKKAETALNNAWTLTDAGVSVKELRDQPAWSVRSRQVFLSDSLRRAGQKSSPETTGTLTYLVNAIAKGREEENASALLPYSMVTAVEPAKTAFLPDDLAENEIALNEWAATDLNVTTGADVTLSYYVVGERRKLTEESRTFRLRLVTPLPAKVPEGEESDWTPQFPGLSEAESCGEWDTGIPIKHKVRDKDEEYWDNYRGSPKAFVSLAAGQAMWGNRWGSLTGLRIAKQEVESRETVERALRENLTAAEAGLLFQSLRQDALDATDAPVDFGQLFLGFSFFVIVAAMALTGMLFAFAMEQRNRQAGLLLGIGFNQGQVRKIFLLEGFFLSLVGVGLGSWLATFYGTTILRLLASDWSGAVSGAKFDFAANPVSVATGACGAIVMALLAMWWSTRRQLRAEPRELLTLGEALAATSPRMKSSPVGSGKISQGIACLLFVAAIGMMLGTGLASPIASMVFFGAGWCLLGAGLLFYRTRLAKAATASGKVPDLASLSRRNMARRSGRSLVTVGAMAAGAFLVVGTGAFRKDSSSISGSKHSGTGGFDLFGETTLPVYDDLNGTEGRELFDLNTTLLDGSTVVPFRIRDGDDASCLNLNKALRPRLNGVKPSELQGRFSFVKGDWSALNQETQDGAIPAVVDQNTLMWALKKSVGDSIEYRDGEGNSFQVRLAAVIKGSMLQGSLYVHEKHFEEKYPKQGGYRGFLVDAPSDKSEAVSVHLTDKLANYGMELRPASERLAELQKVENTYIAIFQALGGLGLLFGTAGLAVVVARNLLERSREFGLMEAVGYSLATLRQLASAEHRGLAFWGLGIGVVSATLGIAPMLLGEAGQKPGVGFIWLLASLLLLCVFWTWLAVTLVLRKSQMSSLRDE